MAPNEGIAPLSHIGYDFDNYSASLLTMAHNDHQYCEIFVEGEIIRLINKDNAGQCPHINKS